MKKSFIYAGAILAATISLTNCTKEINSSEAALPEGIPFEICANPTTKTTIDGLSTKWVAGDALNLFHAVAGSTTYTSDGSFSIAAGDLESKTFKGTLASDLGEGNYDWYAFYPYNKKVSTPANTGTQGYVTVGGKSQTQEGNSSTAHLCGNVCPLYGVAKSVASSATPGITMKHLTSIIEVNVTNNSGSDLTVSNVSFTGTEDIVGTYYIDFTGKTVAYKGSGANYISETASLTVQNGTAIADEGSATFYIAIKPFTALKGSTLALSVNGYEKKLTLTKDIVFTAGHIKTLGFEFDEVRKSLSIDLNKDLYGVAAGSDAAEHVVTVSGVTVTSGCLSEASSKTYYHDAHIRYYANSYLRISAPEAMGMTSIVFSEPSSDKKWNGSISVDSGEYDDESKSWSGDSNDVTFSFGQQNRIASVTIYYTGEITKSDPTWSISPETVSVSEGKTAVVTVSTNYDGVLSVESSDSGKATATINGKEITISGVAEGSSVIRITGPETSAFKAVNKEFTVTVQKTAAGAKTEKEATITFGTNNVKINAVSVNANDDCNNSWTITTVGTTSFTQNADYSQVGASKKPATSITFTTTLPLDAEVGSIEAKFGGFSGTAGTVSLKVGDTSVGSGSLNAANDVTVSSTTTAAGNVVTVSITGISKGVKCYYIKVGYKTAE